MSTERTATPAGEIEHAGGAFVRRSSGLVREFSLIDVVFMNMAGANPGALTALALLSVSILWPGASMVVVLVLGALLSLVCVTTYGMLSVAMPRAGGDFVFVGRTLAPWLGFLTNWMITWSLFVLFGLISVGAVIYALVPCLAAIGLLGGSDAVVEFANELGTEKPLMVAAAIVLLLVVVGVALSGDRRVKLAFRGLASIALTGLAIAIVVMLATGHDASRDNVDAVLAANGGGSLADIERAAAVAGFDGHEFSWSQSLAALPYAFFAFAGVTYTAYLGGEVQRPQRSQPLGMLLSLLLVTVVAIIIFAGFYSIIGWETINSWAFLAGSDPDVLASFPGGAPSGSFLLATIAGSTPIAVVMLVTFLAWFLMIMLFVTMVPVRNLFAWSVDRLIPVAVSHTNAKGTPIIATLIVTLLAIATVFVAVYTDFLTVSVNYTVILSIGFLLTGVAAIVLPYRRRDLFDRAPASVRRGVGGVPVLTIAGLLQTVLMAYLLVEALRSPAFSGPTGTGALLLIVGLMVAAPVVFFVGQAIRRRQGYQVDAQWQTLPPD